MQGVENKVVIIVGASSGLGAAAARSLAQRGAKLALGARRLDRLHALVKELGDDRTLAVNVDVTRFEEVKVLVDKAVRRYGRIDIMLNNAGIMPASPIERLKVEDWSRLIDVNIKGTLHGVAAALPHFKAQRSGHIINISSAAGHSVRPGNVIYSASKQAVRMISEGLRQELKPYNIRTTVISPGMMTTELTESITEADVAERTRARYENAISPKAFTDALVYAISQPDDVDVNEILLRPTKQEL